VEILSPATAEKDRVFKRRLYAKYGVPEYWIVDPEEETIEVLTLGERGYERAGLYHKNETLESPLLPGLRIPSMRSSESRKSQIALVPSQGLRCPSEKVSRVHLSSGAQPLTP
jgi:hypothetical protein